MAITQTGSFDTFTDSNNSGTGSITVPADATLALISVTGFRGWLNFFSAGTITLGGIAPDGVAAADSDTGHFLGATFYWVNPPTGVQTVAWDWVNDGLNDGVLFLYGFYNGIDTDDPVRDSDGAQFGSGTRTTATLTCVEGDKIVAFAHTYSGGANRTHSWTNATELKDDIAQFSNCDAAVAEADPTGDQTVSVADSGNSDGAITAIVFKAAADVTDSGHGSTSSHVIRAASRVPAWVFPYYDDLPLEEEEEDKDANDFPV